MKTLLLLTSIFLTAPLLSEDNYQFYVDQRNFEGDGFIRTTVTQEDSMESPMPVPSGGSEFVLWAVNTPGLGLEPIWTHIGTEVVGAYLPQASLQITTADPYRQGIPRTRVDQPFLVSYTVGGLEPNNAEAPEAAKRVIFDHRLATTLLTSEVRQPDPTATPELVSQSEIVTNGSESERYLASLAGDDPFSESGIETFTINAIPDGQIASLELAKAQVEIWPLATATFNGIEEDKYAAIPAFTVDLTKVYPTSETYLQIYPGPAEVGKVGTKITSSLLSIDGNVSRDKTLSFPNLARFLTAEGFYTIEVVTETVFGVEVLEKLTFEFDNTIDIRGSINSLD